MWKMEITNVECVPFGEGNSSSGSSICAKMAHNLGLNMLMQTQGVFYYTKGSLYRRILLLLNNALGKKLQESQ